MLLLVTYAVALWSDLDLATNVSTAALPAVVHRLLSMGEDPVLAQPESLQVSL